MKIAIIGYGKMGHMIEQIALERGHLITCVIDRYAIGSSPNDCKTANAVRPAAPVRFYSPEDGFQSEAFRSADVAIEFTTPATAEENIRKAWEQGVPVVCGTTGWARREGEQDEWIHAGWSYEEKPTQRIVRDEKGKTMLVWKSNFSVGVNMFFELNKFLAEEMAHLSPTLSRGEGGYTPSIKEIHHIHKLDKPSGTAKTLRSTIYEVRGTRYEGENRTEIPIESIREGEVPGTHEVTWESEEDTIVITHIAKSRRGFALGAVLAAESVVAAQR